MFGFIGNIVRTVTSSLGRVVARFLARVAEKTAEGVVIHAEDRFGGERSAEFAQQVAFSYADNLTREVLSGNVWIKAMGTVGGLMAHPTLKFLLVAVLTFIDELDTAIRENLRLLALDADWRRRNFHLYTEGNLTYDN